MLDVALRLVAAGGLRSVSMEAIAHELGVTRPVVYACFGSREELLSALLTREEQRLFEGVMSALPSQPDFKDPERLMVAGFQALLRVVAERADSWKVVFATDADSDVAESYLQARKRVAERVGQLMLSGLKAREVTDIKRKLPVLVELFMSMGDGAVRALLASDGKWAPDELGAYVGRMVLAAFRKA